MATPGNLCSALYNARPPDAALFLSGADTVTTANATERIASFAASLRALGVEPGDRVTVKLSKSVDTILLGHAVLAVGAIIHPLNDSYTDLEIEALVADAGPRLMVVDDAERARFAALCARYTVALETIAPSGGTLADAASRPPHAFAPLAPAAHNGAALLYTSGTTGKPKGALITHRNLVENARALAQIWQLGPKDVLLHALPVFHAHGLLTSINVLLASGGAIRLLPRFEAGEVLAALPGCTLMMGVPTHYARLGADSRLATLDAPHLRFAISGSSALPNAVSATFEKATGVPVLERYGSTEAAIVAAVPPDRAERHGWVGWPLPEVEIRVAPEGGGYKSTGIGELETRGPHVFAGYWSDEAATSEAMSPDGWFRTGDIAEIDEEGCVRILGRSKEIVISGGLNVYPAEVENALLTLPGIAEAAVFGAPHPDFGEAVVAAVESNAPETFDEAAAIARLRERLAAYKTPKRILVTDALPRNAMGKLQKQTLREAYGEIFTPG